MWQWVALGIAIVVVAVGWALIGRAGRAPGSVTVCLVVRDGEAGVEGLVADALAWCAALGRRGREVLVVDAGSTDETPAVLAQLSRRHPALKIVRWPDDTKEGAGPLQAALAAGAGDWILIRCSGRVPGGLLGGPAGED